MADSLGWGRGGGEEGAYISITWRWTSRGTREMGGGGVSDEKVL